MIKTKELRDQSLAELEALLDDKRKEFFSLKCELEATKKTDKPHKIGATKKEIARLMTVIRQKSATETKE